MKKLLVLALVLAVLPVAASAQLGAGDAAETITLQDIHFTDEAGNVVRGRRCATPEVEPAVQARVQREMDSWLEANGYFAGAAPEAVINVPVAFHVIYRTRRGQTVGNVPQSQIDDQIAVLNAAYAGTGFTFSLDTVTRTDNRKWFDRCYSVNAEAEMKQALAVDPAHTLNIYSCNPAQGILGYAYLPFQIDESSVYHGVVLLYSSLPGGTAAPYNLGDTATHEVGHYLGLYHTFENGCSSPGDEVADTPYEASPAFGCPVGRDSCPSAGLDPIFNFMDYTDDDCMDHFTADQGTRMQTQVAIYKPSLGF